jgi:hypothetical protein
MEMEQEDGKTGRLEDCSEAVIGAGFAHLTSERRGPAANEAKWPLSSAT